MLEKPEIASYTYSSGDQELIESHLQQIAAGDCGAAFENPFLEIVRLLQRHEHATYQRLRDRIKTSNSKVGIAAFDEAVNKGQKSSEAKNAADLLIELALERCRFFHDKNDAGYAIYNLDGHDQCQLIEGSAFKKWLSHLYYSATNRGAPEMALQMTIQTVLGKAIYDSPLSDVFLRVAHFDDRYFLDMCNSGWEVVEITSSGWSISNKAPVNFTRGNTMHSLPQPTRGGNLDKLWSYLNIPIKHRWIILAFILECYRPNTPYVVLELVGEQGSAKSSTQRFLRELIDPNKSANRAIPKSVEDILWRRKTVIWLV